MAEEESEHRRRLLELFRERFGEHIPLIRRQDVRGFVRRKPIWMARQLGHRRRAQARRDRWRRRRANFYRRAAERSTDAGRPQTPGRPRRGRGRARGARRSSSTSRHLGRRAHAESARPRAALFVLQIIQPGLAGLMDGSVSTLAPVFAAAFATHSTWETFLVGMAASVGAGISMGFAEALSDDGTLTGRGHPWLRGLVSGLMTTVGGIGHTLPYLIPDFRDRHRACHRRRARRAVGDRLDPRPLHGHAVPARRVPGRRRRPPRVRRRESSIGSA